MTKPIDQIPKIIITPPGAEDLNAHYQKPQPTTSPKNDPDEALKEYINFVFSIKQDDAERRYDIAEGFLTTLKYNLQSVDYKEGESWRKINQTRTLQKLDILLKMNDEDSKEIINNIVADCQSYSQMGLQNNQKKTISTSSLEVPKDKSDSRF
ncbi:MAG: hypothetical protein V4612_07365 [Pseudomonadota bacterium]